MNLCLIGTESKNIQLKTKPLQFSNKPSLYTNVANASTTLRCAAYGLPDTLSGKWVSLLGDTKVSYNTSKTDNSIEVSTIVRSAGSYICQIMDHNSKIESNTIVKFFKCKFVTALYTKQEADSFKISANMPYICSKQFETS